jgi:muramoyltetrapeptide carboxypeptidase
VSHAGVSSIHAAMPQTYPLDFSDRALTSLHDLLFGDGIDFSWQSPFFKSGSVTAPLVGGNLSVLYSLRGTPIDLDVNGKILLLEDLNEMDYHIDRMFQNLKQGGWFSRIAGLIIGQFTDIKQGIRAFPEPFEDMIKEYTLGYNIPIAINAPIGHIPSQQAVYLNTPAVFEVSSDGLAVVRQ